MRALFILLLMAGVSLAQHTERPAGIINAGWAPTGLNLELNLIRYVDLSEDSEFTRAYWMVGFGYKRQEYTYSMEYSTYYEQYWTYRTFNYNYGYINLGAGVSTLSMMFNMPTWSEVGLIGQYYINNYNEGYPDEPEWNPVSDGAAGWKRPDAGPVLKGFHLGLFAQVGIVSFWVNDAADWVVGFSIPLRW